MRQPQRQRRRQCQPVDAYQNRGGLYRCAKLFTPGFGGWVPLAGHRNEVASFPCAGASGWRGIR
eukprot:978481-Alexandrium_andersonii.AAC.1